MDLFTATVSNYIGRAGVVKLFTFTFVSFSNIYYARGS